MPKSFLPIVKSESALFPLFVAVLETTYQAELEIVTLQLDAVQVAEEPV